MFFFDIFNSTNEIIWRIIFLIGFATISFKENSIVYRWRGFTKWFNIDGSIFDYEMIYASLKLR